MLNLKEYLLVRLAEEAAEVIQRCTKALSYGLHEKQEGQELSNEERLRGEYTDMVATAELLRERCLVYILPRGDEGKRAKKAKILKFATYSREQGALEPVQFPLVLHEDGTDTLYCHECGMRVYDGDGDDDRHLGDSCPHCDPPAPGGLMNGEAPRS